MTEQAARRYARAVRALEESGRLEPRVYVRGCGRCGGDITVHAYTTHEGHGVVNVHALPMCPQCRVDRVLRWSDLVQESAACGHDVRSELFPFGHVRGLGRALEKAGLVQHDVESGTWFLTRAGDALLAQRDAAQKEAL